MAFTLVSPTRRTLVALIAALVVAVSVYETRMLDSGYGAWLDMLGDEDEPPAPARTWPSTPPPTARGRRPRPA
jgi:hypothetical protein